MKKRIFSTFLALSLVVSLLPTSVWAEEPKEGVPETPACTCETRCTEDGVNKDCLVCTSDVAACTGEKTEEEQPQVDTPEQNNGPVIYVSESGDDGNNGETAETAVRTLAEAVDKAPDGATIYVLSNLTTNKLARIVDKNITITSGDGGSYTITRTNSFETISDNARSWYNPAIIEVTTPGEQGASVTLENITLDDSGKHEGTVFAQAAAGRDNTKYVQDAIVAAYGTESATAEIILGNGAVLKDFGGMSAVRVAGGATLTMKDGSMICDDQVKDRMKGDAGSNGPAGAVWVQGTDVTMESGAEICNVVGRAFYVDGGSVGIDGAIYNIKGDADMWQSITGIAIHARGDSDVTLTGNGKIFGVQAGKDENDTVVATYGSNFTMEEDSEIYSLTDIAALYADDLGKNYAHNMLINGTIRDCTTKGSLMRSWYGLITVGPTGLITGNKATGAGGMMYTNNGSRYAIYGTITQNTANNGMMYLANQSGGSVEATLYEGGRISGNTGYGVYINNGSLFTMEGGEISENTKDGVYLREKNETFIMNGGVIRDNGGYGIYLMPTYVSFLGKVGDPLANITGGQIYGNQNGDIYVSDSDGRASDDKSRVMVSGNVLQGERVIKTNFGIVTLDENHSAAGFGTAKPEAKNKITEILATQNPGWTVVGSPLWLKPSTTDYHFTVNRPSSAKRTSLFLAYIPLQADGTPAAGVELVLVPVKNESVIDVTLTGLNPDTAYAVMFVNNKEYTLCPDNTTIYTGGGQDDEQYDNGGFPELTLYNCIDKIGNTTEVVVDGISVNGTAAEKMKAIAALFTVTYKDADGNTIKNDETPGEYTAIMTWKDGNPKEITIGGNNVKDIFEAGTLIIRHTKDKEEAEKGTNTYPLLTAEPAEKVNHAVAIAEKSSWGNDPTFYINNDTSRIADPAGISILDDSLLLEHENDNRQQLMEEKAAEFLDSAGAGKAYAFDFHYLDLVDAYNGNAWVSASYGTTVYLPYPEGTDSTTQFTLIHYKDLHREYGISGQANVEQAIRACELETVTIDKTANGIKFFVDQSGFSPFALVWEVDAHTIIATAGPGGSIDPSGEITVGDGMGKYFVITPDSGYHISDVKVDGVSLGNVSSYNFERVTADHTIEATFSKDSSGGGTVDPTPSEYTLRYETNGGKKIDSETYKKAWTKAYENLPVPVRAGYVFEGWYRNSTLTMPVTGDVYVNSRTVTLFAKWSEEEGLTPDDTGVSDWLNTKDHRAYLQGIPNNRFAPGQNMTRAEVAQMFYNLLLDQDVPVTAAFTDVAADAWYADAVNALASMGILKGVGGGKFEPTRNITRAEFTAIAMRFADLDTTGTNPFSDVSADDWFCEEVVGSVQYGWIKGFTDGTFRPYLSITRAEVTVIANRMLGRSADRAYVDKHSDELRQFTDVGTDNWAYYDIAEATNSHDYAKSGSSEHWSDLR